MTIAISEVDLITHVLAYFPDDYELVVSELEDKLKNITYPLEIDEVPEKLNARCQRIQKNEIDKAEERCIAPLYKQCNHSCNNCRKMGMNLLLTKIKKTRVDGIRCKNPG